MLAAIHGMPLILVVIVAVIAAVQAIHTVGRDIGQASRRGWLSFRGMVARGYA